MLDRGRADRREVNHVRVRGLEAARDRALPTLQDLALDVHLTQSPLGVQLRARDDRDVLDPLAHPGANRESVANHCSPSLSLGFPGKSFGAPGCLTKQITYRLSVLTARTPTKGRGGPRYGGNPYNESITVFRTAR